MPFIEDTVTVARQQQLAAVANARQMQIELELAMCGPPVLQLVVVEQHLVWQQVPFHQICSQQLPSHAAQRHLPKAPALRRLKATPAAEYFALQRARTKSRQDNEPHQTISKSEAAPRLGFLQHQRLQMSLQPKMQARVQAHRRNMH